MTTIPFRFETKASNLIQLKALLTNGAIPDVFLLTVRRWRENKEESISDIMNRFDGNIIIRSSAPLEDSYFTSMAGAFTSIANVDSNSPQCIDTAISQVIHSYVSCAKEEDISDYDLLIQPMVQDVISSGVVFTRELEKFSPYYIVNYDDQSGRTDSITSGDDNNYKLISLHKKADFLKLDDNLQRLLATVQEVENITQCNQLDIEFAIDSNQQVYILQVRPIVSTRILANKALDYKVEKELGLLESFLDERIERKDIGVYGSKTIYGQMPDWNPAEIIGSHPKPLASSLYQYLIMKSAWREGRDLLGYHHPFGKSLMVMVGGRPYVDVRNSFNSLLPHSIPESLANKLVDYYINRLSEYPEFHDKVEFEVVISCLTFNFEKEEQKLRKAGFSNWEINTLKQSLLLLTEQIIKDEEHILQKLDLDVQKLKILRKKVMEGKIHIQKIPYIVQQLLDDCIAYGTIPFAAFARCAFIGSCFLESLKSRGIFSNKEHNQFLQAIDTVASQMIAHLEQYYMGDISQSEFLSIYGHLRPGTYDITSFRYDEKPELYLAKLANEEKKNKSTPPLFVLTVEQKKQIELLIHEYGFTFSVEQLFSFIKDSIRKREYIKFEFTKNLSLALKLMNEYGKYHGLSRDDLSFLYIEDFVRYAYTSFSSQSTQQLKSIIEYNRKKYELESLLHLPDIIFSRDDLRIVRWTERYPNFITQKKVSASTICLDNVNDDIEELDFDGKIVLIENADPGFDWLFSKKIVALVTKYGGVASHMSIRCAEFGLPAAIGCGEQLYQKLKNAKYIALNCLEKRAEALQEDV